MDIVFGALKGFFFYLCIIPSSCVFTCFPENLLFEVLISFQHLFVLDVAYFDGIEL